MPNWGGAASGAAGGAATGATLGTTVFPGIGTGVGAGIGAIGGGLLGLFGGGNKKEVESDELADLISKLKDASAGSKKRAEELSAMGDAQLRPVMEYLSKIIGGDQNALMQATRPERSRVIDQYDTARKTIGEFGGRGGGANAAMANSAFSQADTLANITAESRRDAVDTSAQLGTQLEGLSLTADQLANADINTILNAILNKKNLKLTESGQNKALASGLAEGLGTLLGLYMTRGSGGTGGK